MIIKVDNEFHHDWSSMLSIIIDMISVIHIYTAPIFYKTCNLLQDL